MEQQAQTLPKGWERARLIDVADMIFGQSPPSETYNADGKGLPFFQGKAEFGAVYPTARVWCTEPTRVAEKDDVLISVRAPVGPTNLAPSKCAIGRGLAAIRTRIERGFIQYYLKLIQNELAGKGTGTTFSAITKNILQNQQIVIAPFNEQKRIVDKIETLFSDLDKGEENLRTAQRLIASYRQSVLKAAVTGELTRDWREANKHRLEPGDKLLRRILQTRREQWKGRGKYEEPPVPNTAMLPKLPDEWVWTTIEQLFNVYVGSTPSRKEAAYWNGNIPWVSSGEVAFCRIKDTKEKITQEGYDNSSVKLHPKGTVLLAMIGEGKTRGQAAILDIEACHNQNAASIRVSETEIPPEYIYYLLLHNYEKNRLVGQGGNQPALNGLKVKKFTVPLPPLEEIQEIVSRVEDIFSQIAALEAWCETELTRSATLRQAILKSAFSGQLVPQDASDEPASELLKRIQAERASTPKAKPAAKRGRPGKRRAA